RMPGIVEAEAMKPIHSVGVPRVEANGFSTGFLDIVELKIAKSPMMQIVRKTLCLALFEGEIINETFLNAV
ncbi:MAG: hypothetical protein OEZ40_10470, partial [Candidatus Bathyarchaeota archaeon]|nr:hypothetical protein [Candidatus Bathyarchaeota archaeon]